ncbi:MAG: GGDEF domain-containing protein [Henriciella sp.]|nr:GGDEF domain-containing protein [Henriciella sp.]
MLRTKSQLHTFVYALLVSIVLICSTIHLSAQVVPKLQPNDPANLIYISVIVSGVLAPPASFMLAVYSNKLLQVQQQLNDLATTDPLTGLLNRRSFEEFFSRECARCARTGQKASILLISLDSFEALNSKYGHNAGDVVLRNVAECLRTTMRYGTDEGARWSGKQFAVALTGTGATAATRAATRFRQRIEGLVISYANKDITVTASIAVVECRSDEDLKDTMKRAKLCLRQAKTHGKNKVITYPEDSQTAEAA